MTDLTEKFLAELSTFPGNVRRVSKSTSYGQRGGEGPTRGKVAQKWRVTLPDGRVVIKRLFRDLGTAPKIATGFYYNGRPVVVVWEGEPAWPGDFGRLTAVRA